MKTRTPLTNRLIDGIALASWGAEDGQAGQKDATLFSDCFPLDSSACDKFKLVGDKVEAHGRPPATMYMVIKMARRHSRLFASVYGGEHLSDITQAIERLIDIREDCPEFPTASSIAETWGRATSQYTMCVTEGAHYILGQYGDGVTFEEIGRFAPTPRHNGGAAWNFAPLFDFDSPGGFWRMVLLPEIQQERQQRDIQSMVAARAKGINQPPGRRKKGKMEYGKKRWK